MPALSELLAAIGQADMIVLGPGSLYSSILPALLVPGIAQAVRESQAPLVYVAPIMSEPGETDGMSLRDHDAAILAHLGRAPDVLLLNSSPVPLDVRDRYAGEGAQILGSRNMTAQVRRRVVYAALLEHGPVAHHDPLAVSAALLSLKKQWGVGDRRDRDWTNGGAGGRVARQERLGGVNLSGIDISLAPSQAQRERSVLRKDESALAPRSLPKAPTSSRGRGG